MDGEAACDRLATRQHGVISREQALEAGMGRGVVNRRLASGRWRSLHPGIYVPRSVPSSWHQRLLAAVLYGGPEALASHRAAGALWRLDGIQERIVEISIPTGRRIRGAIVHRRGPSDHPLSDVVDRIPVTNAARTIIDLASVAPERQTGLALDDALRRDLTTLHEIEQVMEALGSRGRPGTAGLRRLLRLRDERDALTESRLEASLLHLLRDRGIPLPTPQYTVLDGDEVIARLDFAYAPQRIGIEADGFRWHGGRERWARDIRRENRLKLLGWTLLRFSWEDVNDRPESVAAQVRSALGSAAGQRRSTGG